MRGYTPIFVIFLVLPKVFNENTNKTAMIKTANLFKFISNPPRFFMNFFSTNYYTSKKEFFIALFVKKFKKKFYGITTKGVIGALSSIKSPKKSVIFPNMQPGLHAPKSFVERENSPAMKLLLPSATRGTLFEKTVP